MRIPFPPCVPFEIVGHRPGHPVGGASSNEGNASTLRNYLPVQLRRTPRPAWANENNFRASPAEAGNSSAAQAETPAQQLAKDLRALKTWVDQGPLLERAERQEIAKKFTRCLKDPNETELSIIYMQHLTSLPPIPLKVTNLLVSHCDNLRAPPVMAQRSKMEKLVFDHCPRMKEPPDVSRCTGLKQLNLTECDEVTFAPDLSGCINMKSLTFSNCPRLATLPDLAACPELVTFSIVNCSDARGTLHLSPCPQLEYVDLRWSRKIDGLEFSECHALKRLEASHCDSLHTLPTVGHLSHLKRLDLENTPITNLPDDIVNLPRNCFVSLVVSHLSFEARNHLPHVTNAPGYAGPRIDFLLAQPSLARPLDQQVASWRNEAPAHLQQALTGFDWRNVPAAHNPEEFSTFLRRLRETSDYIGTPALRAATQERVAKLLVQLQSDPTLREKCFHVGVTALTSCQDQVAMALMEMEELAMASTVGAAIDSGKYDKNPQELVNLVKGQHRLDIIKAAANKKIADLGGGSSTSSVDRLEVHLGFIIKLREEYGLPVQIGSQYFEEQSRVFKSDLDAVRRRLSNTEMTEAQCDENNKAYQAALAGSPLMRQLLLRERPEEMKAANARIETQIKTAQNAIHERLAALKGTGRNYVQKCDDLKAAYHAAPVDITARETLPILRSLMAEKGIAISLNDSDIRHDTQPRDAAMK